MEDITATVSSSPPLKKHKRSCHPIREGEARRGRTKEEGRRGKFGFCLAKKVRALPQVLFLSNREFLQHDFPKQNDVETTKTVPFFFLNVNAQCTDKWIEKRTPASPSFLPLTTVDVTVTVTPETTFSGRETKLSRSVRPRPIIVESWQFPFSAAFYGERGVLFCPETAFLIVPD